MTTKEKRQILREQAAERMSNQRARDRAELLLNTREIDNAPRNGFVRFMDAKNLGAGQIC